MKQENTKKSVSYYDKFEHCFFRKGEIIIYPKKDSPDAIFIKKGYVREYTLSHQGVELTLHIFSPGSCFPMTWIISSIKNRYFYEALTQVEAYKIPKEKMLNFLKKRPDVLFDLTDRLLRGLDKLVFRIEGLVFASAYWRVVSVLLFLARHFGQKETDGRVMLTYKFTHRDVAALAGISRETASRTLKMAKKRGLINSKRSLIVISDVKILKKELAHII